MNTSIKNLADLASKPSKKIIGLMSGTSLDGLDIALCHISGHGANSHVNLEQFITRPYDDKTQKRLKAIASVPRPSMEEVCLLHSWLGNFHASLILEALDEWNISASEVDCIASHGQTIYHAPITQHGQKNMPNATLQIGDGDHIAHKTGILTISDFRQKHIAAGGEGAPMAALVDHMLFGNEAEDRVLLNIGGIANFTYLPSQSSLHKSVTTDTGPGNTLIDAAVQQFFSQAYDRDGTLARQGSVHTDALSALKSDPYFDKPLPKTTGPEVFNLNWVESQLKQAGIHDLSPKNLIATLTRLSAETIADAIKQTSDTHSQISVYVSGGGLHNPVLIKWIHELLPGSNIHNFDVIGCNPDAKEAVVFAVLANEMLSSEGFEIETGATKKINFGKISFPN